MLARPLRFAVLALSALALVPAAASAAVDPDRQGQWALAGDGPMGIVSAWNQTTGGNVIVAVVDTGVDLTHPDLAPNLWHNPGEVPGNGIDDDGDGLVDDVYGADLVNNDGDPSDDNGHGTHVAGIIGARGDNGVAVAGVAWRAQIMPVKVLDSAGGGNMDTVARGIRYAVGHGARIINLSLVGPRPSANLEAAIVEAQQAGVLVVAAAGNDHADDDATPAYPASFPEQNLISVTSIDRDGALAPTASWGRTSVDIAAPGEAILSIGNNGGEELRSGTSMAAAQVSGALVLLAAARPDLDWRGLQGALFAGARPTSAPVANGRLNVAASLRQIIPTASWRTPAAPRRSVKRPATTTKNRALAARVARVRAKARARAKLRARSRARLARARARVHVALPR